MPSFDVVSRLDFQEIDNAIGNALREIGNRYDFKGSNTTIERNEKQVTGNTPPTFLWHTVQDKAVPVENSLQFATALRKAGVPFALHVYQKGRHGIGLAADKPPFKNIHPWAKDLIFWLKAQGFIVE